jgi:hypothetical protein
MMNDIANKASICSVLALEMIDFSKKSEAEQIEIKNLFNGFINHAVIDIPQEDRMIIDTGSGAMIACSGPQEDALEDALFISITIRDEILKNNAHGATPLYVQFGINLGAARVVKSAIVGVGIDEAQRIMSFAEPNQILVSHVYFEVASKLTQEMAQMFEKYEMHAHEHDIYAVRLLKEAATEESPSIPIDTSEFEAAQATTSKINWTYVGYSLLVLAAFFVLAKLVLKPTEPTIIFEQPAVVEKLPTIEEKQPAVAEAPAKPDAVPTETAKSIQTVKPVQDEPKKAKVAQKKATQKDAVKAETTSLPAKPGASKPEKPVENKAEKPAESKVEKTAAGEKSGWETVKDSIANGSERKCSQAEIAMNQCTK